MSLMQRRMRGRFEGRGTSFLGQAAEAEAERRIVITAVALERYFGKHGRYPETLQVLAPEFLKLVPLDFMTGQPLHYEVTEDGHFVLYSVGLDCVDNGGKIQTPPTEDMKDSARLTNPEHARSGIRYRVGARSIILTGRGAKATTSAGRG